MKKKILCFLVAVLMIANNSASALAAYFSSGAEACPGPGILITSVQVTPLKPARRHTIIVTWIATKPQCYTIDKFTLKGGITFANGQKSGFLHQEASGNQTTIQIEVAGLLAQPDDIHPSLTPRSVEVRISAQASAPVFGRASNITLGPLGGTEFCLPSIGLTNPQASFIGLTSPDANGRSFPKITVGWGTNALPACYTIDNYSITVTLYQGGSFVTAAASKTVTVAGGRTSADVVFDNLPVSADYKPGAIGAMVRAIGTAKTIGSSAKETRL